MKEWIELRFWENLADQVFEPDEGEVLGGGLGKRIVLDLSDARLARVTELERKWRARGRMFVSSWKVIREYSELEYREARLFRLTVTAAFEPAGEECGTLYDETGVCPVCKAGRKQVSALRVALARIPRGKDLVGTYVVGEEMVSQRVADALVGSGMTGFSLQPVWDARLPKDPPIPWDDLKAGRELLKRAASTQGSPDGWQFDVWVNRVEQAQLLAEARREWLGAKVAARLEKYPSWYQLVAESQAVPVSPRSVFGESPFVNGNPYACPMGDTLGHRLLSELYLNCSEVEGSDFARTANYVGFESGFHRPYPFFIVSRRWRELFVALGVKGAAFEVVRCVKD